MWTAENEGAFSVVGFLGCFRLRIDERFRFASTSRHTKLCLVLMSSGVYDWDILHIHHLEVIFLPELCHLSPLLPLEFTKSIFVADTERW
jgi:hypothetical protein